MGVDKYGSLQSWSGLGLIFIVLPSASIITYSMPSSTYSRHSNSSQHNTSRHSSSRTSASSHRSSSAHSKNSHHSSENTLVHAQSLVHRISSDQEARDFRDNEYQQELEQRDGIIGAYKSRIYAYSQCLRGFRGKVRQQENRMAGQAEALRKARRGIRRLREDKAENEERLAGVVGMGQRERRARVEMQERYDEEFKLKEEEVKRLEEVCEGKDVVIQRLEKEITEQRDEHIRQLSAKDDAFKTFQTDFDKALTEKDSRNHRMTRRFIAEKIAFETAWNEDEEWKRRCGDKEEHLRIAGRQISRQRLREEEACGIHERYQRWLDKRDEVFDLRDRELGEMQERARVLWRENGRLREGMRGEIRRGKDEVLLVRRGRHSDTPSSKGSDDNSGIQIRVSDGDNVRLLNPRDLLKGGKHRLKWN